MIATGITLILVLAALAAAVLRLASIHLAADRALRSRKLDLEERSVAIAEQKVKGPPVPAMIPPDLLRRINNWGDLISQESERKIILDLYAEVAPHYEQEEQRWQQVRAHLPKAPADEVIFS